MNFIYIKASSCTFRTYFVVNAHCPVVIRFSTRIVMFINNARDTSSRKHHTYKYDGIIIFLSNIYNVLCEKVYKNSYCNNAICIISANTDYLLIFFGRINIYQPDKILQLFCYTAILYQMIFWIFIKNFHIANKGLTLVFASQSSISYG